MRDASQHMKVLKLLGYGAAAAALAAGAARAEVKISEQPTQNMSCEAGVCTATAARAVLNIGDLTNMLASGDAALKTGSLAKDIVVNAALSWTSASRLTLDAQQSVEIAKPVMVAGNGALTVATNDGGQNGEFLIDPKQSVQFWNLSSSLVIDGNSYTLVGDIKTLAADIAANPSGFYALAKPYDASGDGTYSSSPINNLFKGVFEGLGNTIVSVSIASSVEGDVIGFFNAIDSGSIVRNCAVAKTNITVSKANGAALLAGISLGTILRCTAQGSIRFPGIRLAGGLVGENDGSIISSTAKAIIRDSGSDEAVGGLVGFNDGSVTMSYTQGSVVLSCSIGSSVGGLVGENLGTVDNSFALSRLVARKLDDGSQFGGLVGTNDAGAALIDSYAAGEMSVPPEAEATVGGAIGQDDSSSVSNTYWDLNMGVSDPSQGAGNVKNDPGIGGLTTSQLQAGLPKGFNPKIWAQNSKINTGFPYLLSVPPK